MFLVQNVFNTNQETAYNNPNSNHLDTTCITVIVIFISVQLIAIGIHCSGLRSKTNMFMWIKAK